MTLFAVCILMRVVSHDSQQAVKLYNAVQLLADELLELLRREQELNISSHDSDPHVDAYLKANAASTPDHIATEASLYCCLHIHHSCGISGRPSFVSAMSLWSSQTFQ